MKLQYFALCAAMAIPAAFAQEKPADGPKHFGNGACLPKFLEQYDVDGDGTINEEERQAMIEARKQIHQKLIDRWDEDGDGKISMEEREAAREQLRKLMEEKRTERFNDADTDGDGAISWDEFTALPGVADRLEQFPFFKEIVTRIFNNIAGDDELISLEEFLAIGHHGATGGGGRPHFTHPGHHGGGNRPGPTDDDGGDDPVEG